MASEETTIDLNNQQSALPPLEYYLVDHFLSDEECDALIAASKPGLQVSMVWDIASGTSIVDKYRKSEQMWWQMQGSELVKKIEQKVAEFTKLPFTHGEGLQVVHYNVGGYYKKHFDYFDPNFEGNKSQIADGGQRLWTCLIYLNTVEEGGETFFPKAKIKVKPIKGRAIIWRNVYSETDHTPNPMTFHSAEPVVKGEKWIATKWVRASVRSEAKTFGFAK